jgi:hypothetical protein
MKKEAEELMELRHEAEPGYKTAFTVVFIAGALYLGVILYLGAR